MIHEFAHKIDMLAGEADGHPPLYRRWHAPLDSQAWNDVFDHAYDHFCAQVDAVPARRWNRFERDSLIDPYAADHPSEFFAVCSEALFVRPVAFEAQYPELYRLLARYYRQDPAAVGVLSKNDAKHLIFWHNRPLSTSGKWLAAIRQTGWLPTDTKETP